MSLFLSIGLRQSWQWAHGDYERHLRESAHTINKRA